MASPTYRTQGIVVRKRPLGETDLAITFLDGSGAKVSAVAKGGRKPSSPFSSRLELFSRVDALLAKGRSLDIVKEVRLEASHAALRSDYDLALAAAVAVDAVDRLSQEDLEQPRIFPMTDALLSAMEAAPPAGAATLAAAFLLKALATFGYRPALDACVICGEALGGTLAVRGDGASKALGAAASRRMAEATVAFSVEEGGTLCGACAGRLQSQPVPLATILNARVLMASTFSSLAARPGSSAEVVSLLHLANLWMGYHTGIRLKSLEQLVRSLCQGDCP